MVTWTSLVAITYNCACFYWCFTHLIGSINMVKGTYYMCIQPETYAHIMIFYL